MALLRTALLAAALAMLVPVAGAQTPADAAAELTLTGLTNPPGNVTNDLYSALFTLSLEVQNIVCAQDATATVTLAATALNMSASELVFRPATASLAISKGEHIVAPVTGSTQVVLDVKPKNISSDGFHAKVAVTASFAGGALTGCQPGSIPADSATGELLVRFVPSRPPLPSPTQEMPAPSFLLALAGFGLVAAWRRRF